jgi:hypothetical protein
MRRRKVARSELSQRKPFDVVLLRKPSAPFHEIALHVPSERNGASEAKRSETEKVGDEVSKRAGYELAVESLFGRGTETCRTLHG